MLTSQLSVEERLKILEQKIAELEKLRQKAIDMGLIEE